MVKNAAILERFELELMRREPVDFRRNLAIVEALAEEATTLGVFRRLDPLEGIETIIRVAQAVNHVGVPLDASLGHWVEQSPGETG